jgi:hypothetical protein
VKKVVVVSLATLVGLVFVYYLFALTKMVGADLPFPQLILVILLCCILSGATYLKLLRFAASGIWGRAGICAASVLGGLSLELWISSKYAHESYDSAAVAFSLAASRCQLGDCRYVTSGAESYALLNSKMIYSLFDQHGDSCSVISISINEYSTLAVSPVVGYEQYRSAEYFDTTRLFGGMLQRLYPRVTLMSRSELQCMPLPT